MPCIPVRPRFTHMSPSTPGNAHTKTKPIGIGMPNVGANEKRRMSHLGILDSIARGCQEPQGAETRAAPLLGIETRSPA